MNDGSIVAADIQCYINAGNAVDESIQVGERDFLLLEFSKPPKHQMQSLISFFFFIFLQVTEKILLHIDNVYNIPNLRASCAACRTNLPSNTAFRGFGVPQSLIVIENIVDNVAAVLGRPADQVIFHGLEFVGFFYLVRVDSRYLIARHRFDPVSIHFLFSIRFERSTCTRGSPSPTTSLSSARRTCCAAGTSARPSLTTAPAAETSSSLTSSTAGRRGGCPSSPLNMASRLPRPS